MKLLDLLTSPWAILPAQLLEIQAIYATHLRGEKIDIAAIEARLGRPLANEQQDYRLEDGGVAVLELSGVMAPRANLFMRISGGVSTQLAAQQVHSMRADPRVRAAILAVDSPGGSTLGTPALAEAVRALAGDKPTVTVSQGTLASAAYWVGSAANAVYIEGTTDQVGSIGVVANHTFEPQRPGVVETDITAGKYKRIAAANAPLSAEGKAYLQQQVDHLYSVFVDTVAAHRGASVDQVLEHMADGRVFIGQQAIDAGLVDGVSTVDAMVEQMATHPERFASRRKAVFAIGALPPAQASAGAAPAPSVRTTTPTATAEEPTMPDTTPAPAAPAAPVALTRESLQRDHAALFATLQAEFTAAGAAAECQRIQAVFAQGDALPGHAQLVRTLAFDGKTTGPEAAAAILQAEGQARSRAAAAHAADAPQPVPTSNPGEGSQAKTREQQAADARAYAAQHNVSFVQACQALGITV